MNDKNLGSQKNKLKKIKKSPELRFKGFSDDWEQRKLGELSDNIFGGGTPKTSIPEYWEGTIPWIQSSDLNTDELFNIAPNKYITDIAVKDSATKLVPANSIAIVTRVGVGKLAFMPFQYATSQDFLSLSNLNIDNIFSIFSIYRILQKELKNIQGTSIKGITKPDLLAKTISVPIKMEEQKKIGTFFKQLDNTITLHQRKLDKLKQLKQGYLQKLFPNLGENIPKFRFAYFEDVWEQRKLSEIVKITMGQSPNSENYTTNPDDYILVQGNADMKNGRVFPRVWTTQITKIAEKNDLILSVRAPVGDIGKTDYNVVLGRGVAAIKGNEFIFQLLGKMKQNGYWTKLSTGSTFESINSVDIKNAQILLPSGKEQIQIGYFFQLLDNTIFLHQSKLDKLKTIKKSLLQKMFI
ncbi:restriction endonuclease subunit S [Lactococcus formosensis]|uniref:restriction endonuclease subunit S n=1 Tax=Lactococcus formosensis TaxID=1281486 RepID=UPI002434E676|nr:restriction endonuclease subunit S [Lactococcus formosensis]MDG6112434.1 restriction endonuclease subunit S [Lactococcus formosensis]MDG6115702.1 restriction endonuclease subunit S [Lactococcus formosensis]MDG6118699.1 restriction endonuclease subunit S [Lactococcus formosensis]MDG6121680.1 restriction endonuclease subunit S [Lactococcus formosensis]MDG6123240.1 restriction endonuclease subunit S [Lactococcus formosensis]